MRQGIGYTGRIVFSKLLRRTHLYLALFLAPWVLMYASSTFVMNHATWFGQSPAAVFLKRIHRLRGFPGGVSKDLWGIAVELFCLAVLFWVLSGLWMWWEMRATRRLGLAALLFGLLTFALFLVVL